MRGGEKEERGQAAGRSHFQNGGGNVGRQWKNLNLENRPFPCA